MTNKNDADHLASRAEIAAIASCTCQTKTPEPPAHDLHCRYRVLMDLAVSLSALRGAITGALRHLDHATPRQRNGPTYRAADALRAAVGLPSMQIGGKPSDGLDTPPQGPHTPDASNAAWNSRFDVSADWATSHAEADDGVTATAGGEDGELTIAKCDEDLTLSRGETVANAHLLAAAPDLLAVLTALRNECSGKPRPSVLVALLDLADAAITKATA